LSDTTSEPEAASKPEPAKREKAAKRERPPLLQNAALLAYVGLAGLLITIVLAPPNSLPLMGVLLAGLAVLFCVDQFYKRARSRQQRSARSWPAW